MNHSISAAKRRAPKNSLTTLTPCLLKSSSWLIAIPILNYLNQGNEHGHRLPHQHGQYGNGFISIQLHHLPLSAPKSESGRNKKNYLRKKIEHSKIAIITSENTREKQLFSLSSKFGFGHTVGIAS